LIEINLLPKELQPKKTQDWKKLLPVVLCLTALSMGIGVPVAQWWQLVQYENQIRQIEDSLRSTGYLTKDIARFEQEKKRLAIAEQQRENLTKEKVMVSSFLQVIGEAMPPNARLTKISLQGKAVSIKGIGLSYDALVTFLSNLKESGYFQAEPTVVNSQAAFSSEQGAAKGQAAPSLVDFEIKGEFSLQGGPGQ